MNLAFELLIPNTNAWVKRLTVSTQLTRVLICTCVLMVKHIQAKIEEDSSYWNFAELFLAFYFFQKSSKFFLGKNSRILSETLKQFKVSHFVLPSKFRLRMMRNVKTISYQEWQNGLGLLSRESTILLVLMMGGWQDHNLQKSEGPTCLSGSMLWAELCLKNW